MGRGRWWYSMVGIGLLLPAGSVVAQEDLGGRLDRLVSATVEAGLLSGVIVVARGDEVILERAWGFADHELATPADPSHRFGIASITKVLTEVLVRGLAADGRLNLDTPVERHLPDFPRGPAGGAPTLRHLLTHRAGVPHRVTDPIDETQHLDAAEVAGRVRAQGLLFEPGSERLYSSAGFTVLARVVEVVEGAPFDSVMAARLLRPAGMTGTLGETRPALMAGRADSYRLGSDGRGVVVKHVPPKNVRFLTGAGSLYAPAGDLVRFAGALRDGVFGAELAERTFGDDGLSWMGWGGRTNGYEASVDVLPSEELVVVFLSNLQSAANWQVRERVRDLLLGDPVVALAVPPPVSPPFEDPADLVGSYGPAHIASVDGRLFRGDNEFHPTEGERYYIPASGTTLRFRRDAAGRVDALISVSGSGAETVLPRERAPGATPSPSLPPREL